MLVRILKMIATSGYLAALECTILYYYTLYLLPKQGRFSLYGVAYAVIMFFHLGKQTGIVITTAHYIKHPGG